MNQLEERFGWRLGRVIKSMKREDYKNAFNSYSELAKLFNRLDGYTDEEKLGFYKKIQTIGNDLLFKLSKKKISEEINEEKFSADEFKELTKDKLDREICNLIKKEEFEKALKKHENR